MIRDLLPERDAFYKQERDGPVLFMTDKADEERIALGEIFPSNIAILNVHSNRIFLRIISIFHYSELMKSYWQSFLH